MLICSANDDDLGSGTNMVNVFSNPINQKEIGMIFQWPKTLESGLYSKWRFQKRQKLASYSKLQTKKTNSHEYYE